MDGREGPGASPAPVRLIFDIDTVRAVGHPLRARIIESMRGRPDDSWSVRELAAAIDVPATRLYHHVDVLVRHHLIRPVERRIVANVAETRYRIGALTIQLDPGLFAGRAAAPAPAAGSGHTPGTAFELAASEVRRAAEQGKIGLDEDAPPHKRLVLDRVVMRLTPARAASLHARLFEIAHEYGDDDAPDGVEIGMLLGVYPMPSTADSPEPAE